MLTTTTNLSINSTTTTPILQLPINTSDIILHYQNQPPSITRKPSPRLHPSNNNSLNTVGTQMTDLLPHHHSAGTHSRRGSNAGNYTTVTNVVTMGNNDDDNGNDNDIAHLDQNNNDNNNTIQNLNENELITPTSLQPLYESSSAYQQQHNGGGMVEDLPLRHPAMSQKQSKGRNSSNNNTSVTRAAVRSNQLSSAQVALQYNTMLQANVDVISSRKNTDLFSSHNDKVKVDLSHPTLVDGVMVALDERDLSKVDKQEMLLGSNLGDEIDYSTQHAGLLLNVPRDNDDGNETDYDQ
jgi:hypothetical protein